MPEGILEDKQKDVDAIKEWLMKQPHLPNKMDDIMVLRFLHISNYSIEQAKHLIDLFFTLRSQAPEFFANRDPNDEAVQNVFKTIDQAPLPKPTASNYKLFVYRFADPDSDKFNMADAVKAFYMISDARMLHDTELPDGEVPIFDASGFSLRHLAKVSLHLAKKYLVYSQEAHPVRLKQIHVLNAPPVFDRLMQLFRPFIKSEIAKMIHFHQTNSTTLYDFIPRELLPEELGGTVGKLKKFKDEYIEKVMQSREFFLDHNRWHVDEAKRPEKDKNKSFGIEGSFRTLAID